VVTNAGGLGILCADACDAAGLELAELSEATRAELTALLPAAASVANPVDLLGSATPALFEATVPVLLRDAEVDALIALFVPAADVTAEDVSAALDRGAAGREKPVVRVLMAERRPPGALPYPDSAARALARAAERAEWLRRPHGTVPSLARVDEGAARAVVEGALARADDAWLTPEEARRLLEACAIPVPAEAVAATPAEAVERAREIGFPVVVKSAVPGAHKTETGGVAVDLRDAEAVRAAAARIGPPVLVQELAQGDAELLAGIVQDPVFGPLVAFGPGGVLAELIGEAVFRIAPLTDVDAEELVAGGKAGRLVAGFRGKPPLDADALTGLLHALSQLAVAFPELAELDLNPVIGSPDGCVAVDARVRVRRAVAHPLLKTW
jgi:acyl-CoA synthetase (NDP forming)